jgi:hypothetical protein
MDRKGGALAIVGGAIREGSMSGQWFYRLFGQEFGPISREGLEELSANGTLGSLDEVRAEGSREWVSLDQALSSVSVATAVAEKPSTTDRHTSSADEEPVWYYEFMGEEMGPTSFNELLHFAEIGQLTADDQVKFGADGKWRRLGAIGRLVAVLPYQDHAARPAAKPAHQTPADDLQTLAAEFETAPSASSNGPAAPAAPATPPEPPVIRYLPAAEEKTWYAWIAGAEYGPTDLVTLNQWITSGRLGPTDLVRYGMIGQWASAMSAIQALAQLRIVDQPAMPPMQYAPAAATAPVSPAPVSAPPAPQQAAPAVAEPTVSTTGKAAPVKLPPPPDEVAPPSRKDNVDAPVEKPSTAARPSAIAETPKPAPTKLEKPESNPAPRSFEPSRTTSSYGGGMSSPPAWQTASKPAFKPPPKKKSSGGGGGLDLGALLAPLKETKVLAGVGGVVAVAALVGLFMFMPASTGADIQKLKQLQEIQTKFKQLREQGAAEGQWQSLATESESITKPMVEELKKSASRKYPAKQLLLWASRDRLPQMFSSPKNEPSNAETEFDNLLSEAARILRVK